MKRKVIIKFEKGKGAHNFSAFVEEDIQGYGLAGYGKSAKEAAKDIAESDTERIADLYHDGIKPEHVFGMPKFDLGSAIDYFEGVTIDGISKKTGIDIEVIKGYANENIRPILEDLQKIEDAVNILAAEEERWIPMW